MFQQVINSHRLNNRLLTLIGLLMAVMLSSCGLLLKQRTVANSGTEHDDFGLPLVIYHPLHARSAKMVVLLSGDGGWLGFNDTLAVEFAKRGYHVIGFNSRTYFWKQRHPDETAADFTKLISKYSLEWKIKRVILSGYSFGADVVPFIYNRLPDDQKKNVSRLLLLSPYSSTDFRIHFTDLFRTADDNRTYKVTEELKKINIPVCFFYGQTENPRPLADIVAPGFSVRIVAGDHHYRNSYQEIVHAARNR
jgi:type IV secretory pathway VirJ component